MIWMTFINIWLSNSILYKRHTASCRQGYYFRLTTTWMAQAPDAIQTEPTQPAAPEDDYVIVSKFAEITADHVTEEDYVIMFVPFLQLLHLEVIPF